MKICPRCQRTYTDDNLNFCLDDGVVLQQTAGEPPATVFMNQPRPTDPRPVAPSQPGFQPAWNTAPQPYAMQPQPLAVRREAIELGGAHDSPPSTIAAYTARSRTVTSALTG